MWDAILEDKFAVKSTSNKKDIRAYRLSYHAEGNGAGFSAKTFLDYIGFDYSERRTLPIELNPNNEIFLEVQIPETFLKGKQPRLIERSKAG